MRAHPHPHPIRRRAVVEGRPRPHQELRRLMLIGLTALLVLLATAAAVVGYAQRQVSASHQDAVRALGPASQRAREVNELAHASRVLNLTLLGTVAALTLFLVIVLLLVRRMMVRPITQLSAQVRHVTEGDYDRDVAGTGPQEIVGLGEDVDLMRRRIIDEWTAATEARGQLDSQAAELRRSNAELEQFAYVASHDLQEPLRKVAAFSQLLRRRYGGRLDERADTYLRFAADGAQRMQDMVAGLLEFSRVGRRGLKQTAVDLNEQARQALLGLSSAVEDSDADVDVADLPVVDGDPVLLRQLLQNLVGNAIRFRAEERPRLCIDAAERDGVWEFRCVDNGIGIDAEHAERVFAIFQRLHAREEDSGTGIGLSLSKKIVEHHGGRIWLDTGTDRGPGDLGGTMVRWTLPARAGSDDDAAAPSEGAAADVDPSGSG